MADSDKDILIVPNTGETSDPTITFSSGATGGDPITLSVVDDGTTSALSITASSGNLLYLENGGNIGIGTDSPATALDVSGTVTADVLKVESTNNTGISAYISNNTNEIGEESLVWIGGQNKDNYGVMLGATAGGNTPGVQKHAFIVKTNPSTGLEHLTRLKISHEGDISFYENTGTTPKFFWDASTERLGIGTASPLAPLSIDTSAANPIIVERDGGTDANVSIQFNGATSNYYVGTNPQNNFAIGTDLDQTNAPFQIDSSGNVGIGTSSPATLLHAKGSSNEVARMESTGTTGSYVTFQDADTAVGQKAWIGANGDLLEFYSNNSTLNMTMTTDGNVGIGTDSPVGRLDVIAEESTLIIGSGANQGNGTQSLQFRDRYGTPGFDDGQIGAYVQMERQGTNARYDLTFGTISDGASDATERMRISDAGNVGIGTSSPNQLLTLGSDTGSDTVGLDFETNNTSRGSILYNANAGEMAFTSGYSGYGGFMTFECNGSERMRIDTIGRVGIGTTNPGAKLQVEGGNIVHYANEVSASLTTGRSSGQNIVLTTTDGEGSLTYNQDETDGTDHSFNFIINSSGTNAHRFTFNKPTTVQGEYESETSENAWGFRATTSGTSNSSGLWFTGTTARLLLRDSSETLKTMLAANGINSQNVINGNTIWHAGNHGAGSGLDADKLDNVELNRFPYALSSGSGGGTAGTTNTFVTDGGIGADNIARSMFFRDNNNQFSALGIHVAHSNNANFAWQIGINSYSDASTLQARVKNSGTWETPVTIWNSGNDGSGSGLDADTLDGVEGSGFIRSDADSEFTGTIKGTSDQTNPVLIIDGGGPNIVRFLNDGASATGIDLVYRTSPRTLGFEKSTNGSKLWETDVDTGRTTFSYDPYVSTNKIWHEGNHGAGSGLDADKLDGQEGSFYRNASNLNTGTVPAARIAHNSLNVPTAVPETGRTAFAQGIYTFNTNNASLGDSTPTSYWSTLAWGNGTAGSAQLSASWTGSGLNLYFRSLRDTVDDWWAWKKIWHEANDGPGSGLNADLLDGYQHTAFGPVVARHYRSGSNSAGRLRIRLPFLTNSAVMLSFVITQYTSYTYHEYKVSGYLYPTTNNWHVPKAVYTGTGTPNILFGRDSDGIAYVSIADNNYTGLTVHSVNVGYSSTESTILSRTYDQGWEIVVSDTAPNQSTATVYKTWSDQNDGSGSGLNADLLDGIHGSSFVRGDDVNNGATTIKVDDADFVVKDATDATTNFIWRDHSANVLYLGTANAVPTLRASLDMNSNNILNYNIISNNAAQSRDKLRVWSSSLYTIGMKSGFTYGHLNEYAMSFQMNNDNDRGFWWGDDVHTDAQGAMSLTTEGRLTVATSLSVGEGQSITSPSTETLYVSGNATFTANATVNGTVRTNIISCRSAQQLVLNAGEAADKFTGQTSEYIYLNAEQGLSVNTPDRNHSNFETGYTQDSTYIRGDAIIINGNTAFHDGYHPNADKWTTARTITLGGDLTGNVTFDGSSDATLSAQVVNDSHTHQFNNLTNKTSGTGDYSTSGDLVSGRGSGGVALTINDGKGNANVTFNHQNGTPEQNGNAARIEVNTDSTSGAAMYFELKSGVTSGTSVDLTPIMTLTESAITAGSGVSFTGNLSGNASTATKWATAKTITLGGDLTGSVTFDGSSGATLSAQVVNDSHTHDTRYMRTDASTSTTGNITISGLLIGNGTQAQRLNLETRGIHTQNTLPSGWGDYTRTWEFVETGEWPFSAYGYVDNINMYSNSASWQYFYAYQNTANTPIRFRNATYNSDAWFDWREIVDTGGSNQSKSGGFSAYSIQGNANVAGTGNASYHPSGIYSTGTNWLYGTLITNNNSINAGTGTITAGNVNISSRLTITGAAAENALEISGTSPTIALNDTNQDSFYIHANSNNFYVLADRDGSGAYSAWETPHPLQLEADTNTAYAFGAKIVTGNVTGSLFADIIAANVITANMIQANSIVSTLIQADTISANNITTGTLDADNVTIANLTVDELSGDVSEHYNSFFSSPNDFRFTFDSSTGIIYTSELFVPDPSGGVTKRPYIQGWIGVTTNRPQEKVQVQIEQYGFAVPPSINLGQAISVSADSPEDGMAKVVYSGDVLARNAFPAGVMTRFSTYSTSHDKCDIFGHSYDASTNRTTVYVDEGGDFNPSTTNDPHYWHAGGTSTSPNIWRKVGTSSSVGNTYPSSTSSDVYFVIPVNIVLPEQTAGGRLRVGVKSSISGGAVGKAIRGWNLNFGWLR